MIVFLGLMLVFCAVVNLLIHNSNKQFMDCSEEEAYTVNANNRVIQSSCQMEAINRHRHNNWMRANSTAPNCGRKPRYKDHGRKEGLRAKEALAAWN